MVKCMKTAKKGLSQQEPMEINSHGGQQITKSFFQKMGNTTGLQNISEIKITHMAIA